METTELPQETISKNRKSITKLASEFWNEVGYPTFSIAGYLRPLHHWLTGHIVQVQKGQRVLEVGAGYPLYKLYSERVGENGLFVALDVNERIQQRSKNMLYVINGLFKEPKNPSEQLVTADASPHLSPQLPQSGLPFGDGSFDLLIASNYTGGQTRFFEEAFRVLKPEGRFIWSNNEFLGIPLATSLAFMSFKKSGFQNLRICPGTPGSIPVLPVAGMVMPVMWNWYIKGEKPKVIQQRPNL